jgi:hypothetical protein
MIELFFSDDTMKVFIESGKARTLSVDNSSEFSVMDI